MYLDLAQTLTNKTLSTGSTWSGNTITVANGGTGATTFTSGNFLQGNGTGAVTATKVVPTGVVVGTTDTQTLTNKTLTSPRIGTNILDTNGNELLLLTATGSAVNELTLANAATGTNPTITASGNDTNIGINLQTKGTGTVEVSSASATDSGIVRLLDNTGGEYGAITVPDAVTTSYTLQLPDGVGTNGQFLRTDGNNPATLTWAAPAGGGDVIGPGSSTDNAIVRWNGASGTSIQDSNVLISDTDSMTGLVNVGMSGDILDANGNELINLVTTASAVNEISITNAATGTNPIIGATGGDTNISLEYRVKGTGVHIFDNDTAAAEIRLQDNAGTDYVGIRPAATTTSYTLTMPPAQGGSGQVLQNNGAGILSWASAGGTIANSIATATVDTSTTSATYVVMNSMTITPAAGTYLVLFSTSGDISGNNLTANYAIFNNGTIVQHSERNYASAGGQTAGLMDALTTQSIETVAGGQAIDVRYQVSGGSITIHERSLILVKLA